MNTEPVVVLIETEKLFPYAMNSRTHSSEQVAQIAASIREFGFTNPVLIDEKNGIIAGHGRVLAAEKIELERVPCIKLSHLSEAQKKAYVIADNKIALNAGWDFDLLKAEIDVLREVDFNVDLLGFDVDELNRLYDGWNSDIDYITKSGENLNGILSVIRIQVAVEDLELAKEKITNSLDGSGVCYEFK